MVHRIETVDLGGGSIGTHRKLVVHHFGEHGARPKIYLHACLHGDETPATAVLSFLIDQLRVLEQQNAVHGHIVVVPVANPIALDQSINGVPLGRFSLSTRHNFNRKFPYIGDAVLQRLKEDEIVEQDVDLEVLRRLLVESVSALEVDSEETQLKIELLKRAIDADYVFDMHCTGVGPLYGFAWHSTNDRLRQHLADLGLSTLFINRDSGAGTFEDACADLWEKLPGAVFGCQPCCVEYRGVADVDADLAADDAKRLVRMLGALGFVEGEDPNPRYEACEELPAHGLTDYYSPASGLLLHHRTPGCQVEAGEMLAEIKDPLALDAGPGQPVQAPLAGYFLQTEVHFMVKKGDLLGTIASPTAQIAEGENPFDD